MKNKLYKNYQTLLILYHLYDKKSHIFEVKTIIFFVSWLNNLNKSVNSILPTSSAVRSYATYKANI